MKPCNRCGKCCKGSPCGLAEKHGMVQPPNRPCVALVRIGGYYSCGLLVNAKPREAAEIRKALKIGEGCHLW